MFIMVSVNQQRKVVFQGLILFLLQENILLLLSEPDQPAKLIEVKMSGLQG